MMKIAIPLAAGQLCMHFGHCEVFAVIDADVEKGRMGETVLHTPPPHEPGVLPRWIGSLGVDLVIAGGMGMRARELLEAQGIRVITGAPVAAPEELAAAWLDNRLKCGDNVCNHDGEPHSCSNH